MNGTDLLQDEHFVRYSERWMLYGSTVTLIASLPEVWYANASEPDCRWRRLRGAQASLNLRFSQLEARNGRPQHGDVMN